MPEESYRWLRRQMLLSFEELTRLARLFQQLGVERVRLTGGEPLLRKDLPELVRQLKDLGLHEVALTSNGLLLAKFQEALFAAGLDRVTVSLDAVDPQVFGAMSGRDDLDAVLEGLRSVAHRPGLKIDSVIVAGTNDSQIVALLELGQQMGAEVRFIEYMDVGGATRWSADQVCSQEQILAIVAQQFGPVTALGGRGSAPAQRFQAAQGPVFGVIASVSRPFCRSCDRARLTADGQLLTCLYGKRGSDLRQLLRGGASDRQIVEALAGIWTSRSDRGAEQRVALRQRGPLADVAELQENLHLEMHTRGG
jgi:cyclic pyranopterin phosphate synthase